MNHQAADRVKTKHAKQKGKKAIFVSVTPMPDLSHPLNSNKTNKINRNRGGGGKKTTGKSERASLLPMP